MIELRPYQEAARKAIQSQWCAGVKRTLLQLPTGCGKTIVFASVIADQVRKGERVLVLAHRNELLMQAADKLQTATGLKCSIERAEETSRDSWYRVTVGSVQTLQREQRLKQFAPNYFETIVVDEAHHILSDGYQYVLSHFADAKVLGVTATNDRADKRNLGQFFQTLAYEYTLPQAIHDGYLSPIKALTIPLRLDLSQVTIQSGDFKAAQLGNALDPYLYRIADEIRANCVGRKTLVFLPLIKTSQKFCAILNEKGIRAAEVNGKSRNRAEITEAFARGDYEVLCNSMLLTEGWDCPAVDCVVPLRPTKIRSLYYQMVGRGTRLSPGKADLLLLDFLWHTDRHELYHPAHLIADEKDVAKRMTENIADAGHPVDLEEAASKAQDEIAISREEALAKRLAEQKHKKRKLVDPLAFELSIQDEDLANYIPTQLWEMAPVSLKQREILEHHGIDSDNVDCSGKATMLLDRLQRRISAGLTSPKQIRLLERKGFQNVAGWQFEDAKKLIDRIAATGWVVPRGIDPKTYKPGGMQ